MPSWLPSISYPPPDQPGYWDPVTSTINWCEEVLPSYTRALVPELICCQDYYATYYSAEIVNTLTNLAFMYLAYRGIRNCLHNDHDTVFIVAYFGYFLVGVGSFLFHTTLKYPWQLFDELNMIYTTCLMVYVGLSYRKSSAAQIALAVGLVVFCTFVTLYYHYLQDPTFHQTVYAALTIFIVFKSCYDMEYTLRPSLRNSEHEQKLIKEQERDMSILRAMWVLVAFGIFVFLSGFALWGIDRVACSQLRLWRRQIGLPWGKDHDIYWIFDYSRDSMHFTFLKRCMLLADLGMNTGIFLEGHGFWHLLTGLGAYDYIVWETWLRHTMNAKQEDYELRWPHFYTLPEIVKTTSPTKSDAKGHGKKTS